MFPYNLEMARNPRAAWRFCARSGPEKASRRRFIEFHRYFLRAKKKRVASAHERCPVDVRLSIASVRVGDEAFRFSSVGSLCSRVRPLTNRPEVVRLADAKTLQLLRPLERQIDPVEQRLSTKISGLTSLADRFDDSGC